MVAIKASKEVPKNAVVWALTHVVQPGDYITLHYIYRKQKAYEKRTFDWYHGFYIEMAIWYSYLL